jgi:hypothetical protein
VSSLHDGKGNRTFTVADLASASAFGVSVVALLHGVFMTTSGVTSLLLIGDDMHLGLVVVLPA